MKGAIKGVIVLILLFYYSYINSKELDNCKFSRGIIINNETPIYTDFSLTNLVDYIEIGKSVSICNFNTELKVIEILYLSEGKNGFEEKRGFIKRSEIANKDLKNQIDKKIIMGKWLYIKPGSHNLKLNIDSNLNKATLHLAENCFVKKKELICESISVNGTDISGEYTFRNNSIIIIFNLMGKNKRKFQNSIEMEIHICDTNYICSGDLLFQKIN